MRLALSTLLAATITLPAAAQQVGSYSHVSAPPHTAAPERKVELPVTSVSLYKNGVGFFEHTGFVHGDAKVTIDFTSAQLNDVLQSLSAIDLNGGRISGAGYNSTTPLDQQLRSLSLGLGLNTNSAQYLNAIRGSRVEVHGSGAPFTGRLMNVEQHPTAPADKSGGMTETTYLSVISDSGEMRIFPLTSALSVRVLDGTLHDDVNHYLSLLDSTRNQGLRHLTLDDRSPANSNSNAARELRVSYISEVPVWKSTYRILFTENPKSSSTEQTATLQGWSVIDNTTGVDWINVHLSLIAGAPQSFIQPLSQPIYARRPEIPIATQAQLTPQTFDSGISQDAPVFAPEGNSSAGVLALPPARRLSEQRMVGSAGGAGNGVLGGYGIGAGSGVGIAYGGTIVTGAAMNPDSLSYQAAAAASLAVKTNTSTFDDFFAYNITDPVTIHTNESALVPILQSKVNVDRVTLVSYRNGAITQPLCALWLTNTTGLTLDRGSFSIVENGAFGGEGLLDPIHAEEKRLLSYAADQAVHVSTENDKTTNHLTQIRASKGVVNIHRADEHEVTFVIHNSAADRRTVVTEVPVIDGWKLLNLKPDETTGTVYRFRTEVAPGETVRLHVPAQHSGFTTFYLSRTDDNQLAFMLNSTDHNAAFEAALQPVIDARHRVADAQTALNQTNSVLNDLRQDEERQRANITALNSADKASRDRFVHDLNQTEDKITAAQTELTTRTAALEAAKADLANRIDSVNLDTPINKN
jgi:hypothetical protein